MSKKKETKTATILIRLNGDETTAALLADGYSPGRIKIARARRNPDDTYDAYEGARIALARLYGKEPFPEAAPKAKPKPTKPQRFKVGDLARVKMPMNSFRLYDKGDLVKITEIRPSGYYVQVVDGPRAEFFSLTGKFTFVSENELEPSEAGKRPAEKPFQPSFQVGDIVRTGDKFFAENCRNQIGRVKSVKRSCLSAIDPGRIEYAVQVFSDSLPCPGTYAYQYCYEGIDEPAPMTLLYREGKEK